MSARGRITLVVCSLVPLCAVLFLAVTKLPRSGQGASLYGDLLVGGSVGERHSTDVVTSINFDYRAADTVGEEFILFASVLAVVMLLRRTDEERACDDDGDEDGREAPKTSDAMRVLGISLLGLGITFGLYIITHGQLTPGGGFQGGVITATAWVLLYLSASGEVFQRLTPKRVVEAVEAAGAAGFVLLGIAGMIWGVAFLANFLPLGPPASVMSGGTIPLLSLATGFEVTGGFVLLFTTFVEEALEARVQS